MTLLSLIEGLLQVLEVDTVGDVTQHDGGANTNARSGLLREVSTTLIRAHEIAHLLEVSYRPLGVVGDELRTEVH